MRKVTTINLNNNAYQVDEEGYEALRRYLENAARALATNPDRAEILADLEQAIADKCRLTLGPHKSVVSTAEIERILQEMGPVAGSSEEAAAGSGPATDTGSSGAAQAGSGAPYRRRLYRVREGQVWAGVCTGLAAYTGTEVTWVRVAAILLTVFTGFVLGLIVYVSLVLILPVAMTAEEHSAAHGQPFNAQELVDRIKKKHEDFRSERRARRMNRHAAWSPPMAGHVPPGYAARVTGGVLLPLLTVMSAVWFAAMAIVVYSVWWGYRHAGFGAWPPEMFHHHSDIPFWLAMVAVVAVYALVALPIGAGRRASLYYANGGRLHGWADAWSGLLWLAIVAVILLSALYQLPQLQELLRGITGETHSVFALHLPAWHELPRWR